ncbi:MAG: hypothetical protein GXO80_12850 [Chlorobi bacterium]|nr:hypothetical protein [Chlorobiota bacterium]
MRYLASVFLIILSVISQSQNRYLSIGNKQNGICFGNSELYNGLRINFLDKNTDLINGMNISVISKSNVTNGVKFSLQSYSQKTNGINFVIWGLDETESNGFTFATAMVAEELNGLGIGLISATAKKMNGVFFTGIIGTMTAPVNQITGIAVGLIFNVQSKKFNGLAIGGTNDAEISKGLLIGVFNFSKKHYGIQIGLNNNSEELHGLQIGLWNTAMNNSFFKRMPLINFNFKRK